MTLKIEDSLELHQYQPLISGMERFCQEPPSYFLFVLDPPTFGEYGSMDVFIGGIVSKVLDEGHGVSEHEVEEDHEARDIYVMVVASLNELRHMEG
ncbi:hypothetical protein GOP47_0018445 [Adiantum capillus-veneris]|uniref:Uncharacterized protein n=1 Tax=Adiantum capillus-veneris TaxID=13818 RepID=A0A9D4UEP2_ADICA|nr:hypothetical protein GOP47_0018445 [Adiantum capillus-veneris]